MVEEKNGLLSLVSLFLVSSYFYLMNMFLRGTPALHENILPFCDPMPQLSIAFDGVLWFLFQCCRSLMFSSRDQLRFMLQIKLFHCVCVAGKEDVRGKERAH